MIGRGRKQNLQRKISWGPHRQTRRGKCHRLQEGPFCTRNGKKKSLQRETKRKLKEKDRDSKINCPGEKM